MTQHIDYQAELVRYEGTWVPEVGEKVILKAQRPRRDQLGVGTVQHVGQSLHTSVPAVWVRWSNGTSTPALVRAIRHAFDYETQEQQ